MIRQSALCHLRAYRYSATAQLYGYWLMPGTNILPQYITVVPTNATSGIPSVYLFSFRLIAC